MTEMRRKYDLNRSGFIGDCGLSRKTRTGSPTRGCRTMSSFAGTPTGETGTVTPSSAWSLPCSSQQNSSTGATDGAQNPVLSARPLSGLHLAACETVRPDPVALARRLVDRELTSDLDGFHRAAATYADVLGEPGFAEYRRILEPRWEAVTDETGRRSNDRFPVEQAMIGVALGSGDPDELIKVRGRDLRTPDGYLEIAGALVDADR